VCAEYARLSKNPPPHIEAAPSEHDILQWTYVLTGPADSPYAGGVYMGKLVFPAQYPFKPPSIQMHTPSGRFQTDTRLCLSMSDFHPETWNPAWSVSSILTGLLSFMLESTPTLGSVETSDATKREYARKSMEFNLRNPTFKKFFPHYVAHQQKHAAASAANASQIHAADAAEAAGTAEAEAATVSLQRRRHAGDASQQHAESAASASAASAANSSSAAAVTAADASGPAAVAALGASALQPRGAQHFSLFGDRIRIRTDQLWDYAALLFIGGTLFAAARYLVSAIQR